MSARGRNGTTDSPQAGAVPGDPTNAAQSGAGRADAEATEAAEATWRRLDPRIIAVTSTGSGLLIITAAVIMWWRDAPWWLHAAVPPPLLCFPVYEWWRWLKTTYRLTPERIELRTGVLVRSHRSIPRHRVRSVDVSANPLRRIFGLSTVKVGTGHRVGTADNAVLTLDALSRRDAETLRQDLVRRTAVEEDQDTIGRIDWKWLRYAPLSSWAAFLGLSAVGGTYEVLDTVGADPDTVLIPQLFSWLSRADLLPVIVLGLLGLVVVGACGATGLYVEMWWDFRLLREPNGALRATRGLFVTRSVTLEEERLRGMEIAEPLLLRWGGGAYTYAVASGTGSAEEEISSYVTSAMLPPAPLAEAHRVAAAVLREEEDPTASVRLVPHTRHALLRRLRWAFFTGTGLGGLLVLLGVLLTDVLIHIGWTTALVAYAAGALFARDAARSLGHGVTGRYLVTRHGSVKRRTIALRRDGVIGWNVTQWAWHRRSGLCTLTATTAGGRGAYDVKDVLMPEGLRFADESVPTLLDHFVTRGQDRTGTAP
ncbi:PH domain-containing protein [Streptomyces sp. MNU77]|uniref:PH domain-containing protein n=1 Tax=Streptomyces sp. MNU77 TaxID=1573406 RepID=UPI000696D414|nr:PH domain-containing protein [Streptomyces sp. MNU77]